MRRTSLHWAWVILGVCFLDLFVNYSIRLGFGVILPEMIKDLHLTRTQGGNIFNSYLAVYILFTPFVGNITDRYGARKVITSFGFLLASGAVLMGTTKSFEASCVYYAIVGAGASAMWTPVLVVVQRWFARTKRGLALGILSTGYGLGFATMGWVFPKIVEASSWRASWYLLGVLAACMIVLNGTFLRSRPEDKGLSPWGGGDFPEPQGLTSRGVLRTVISSQAFWLIGMSYMCVACALYMVTTFMVDYAQGELGLPLSRASFLATIHGLCQVVGVLTIAPISDLLGRRRTIVLSNILVAMAILGIAISSVWPPLIYGVVALLGVVYGATWPLYGACGGDYFKKEVMGTIIGGWTPFYGGGAIAAHLVAGTLRDTTASFQGAFFIAVALAFIAALLLWRVGEPTFRRSQPLSQ